MLSLADSLAWADPVLATWFHLWGAPVSGLEAVAVVLALWMVRCNLRVSHWAWPLAIISSLAYALLFARSRLYGEACLQIVFVTVGLWGWAQWLWGRDTQARPLRVRSLSLRQTAAAAGIWLLLWPVIGLTLMLATDSDVPFADAFPTSGSLVGQFLLARKWVQNWPCWLLVNIVSMGLFAHKGLWLTLVLYGVFAALSVLGWYRWHQMAAREGQA